MALQKYQEYLAAQVLNEDKAVNYKLLSRALQVHVNTAKQMLYEFHRAQNARKPESVHATYLLCGVRKPQTTAEPAAQKDGEDSFMQDSFAMSSSMPDHEDDDNPIPVTTITLVAQENLDAVKEQYSSISSIHIYSLQPGPIKNLQLVSDCNRRIRAEYTKDDPLQTWKVYGNISNPAAKRRERKLPLPVAAAAVGASTTKPEESIQKIKPTEVKEVLKTADKKAPAQLKKENSNLFKSFAKTKPPEKKPDVDSPMKDVENDDEEDTADAVPIEQSEEAKAQAETKRKERIQREEQLRKMMEDDAEEADEEMKDGLSGEASEPEEPEEDQPESQEFAAPKEPTPEPVEERTTVTNGRRHGRRRVTKKKTYKDADGYIVTKEVAEWESFSESEPEPAPKKSKSAPAAATAPAAAKAEKGTTLKKGGKPGHGNIMNFFAKK